MSINDYARELESIIVSCSLVTSYVLNIDVRSNDIVFISGRLDFRDGSILDFKEFIEDTETKLEKFKYGYNYRKSSKVLFRYDNALDPRARKLASYPTTNILRVGKLLNPGK